MPKFARPTSYNGRKATQKFTGDARFATLQEAIAGIQDDTMISPATMQVGTLGTLSGEGGALTPPVGGNFNLAGSIAGGAVANGAIIFSTPANGQMNGVVQTDGSTITINALNQLAAADKIVGTVTTIGAVTLPVVTLPLGAVPAVYTCEGRIAGFNATDIAGGGYFVIGAVRTTGAAGIEIAAEVSDKLEEAAMTAADVVFVVVGNTIEIQVVGIAAKTIRWSCELEFERVI